MSEVAVFRALVLGDLLCATPALRALRQGLPQARITLVGLASQRALAERLPHIDAFIECPGWPGLPEQPTAARETRLAFLRGVRGRHFDLALQLHGSGAIVNRLVAAFGARRTVGFAAPGAWRPPDGADGFIPWPDAGSESERLCSLTDHLGLPRRGLKLDFPLRAQDHDDAAPLLRALRGRRFVLVHAGAQLPSRRWPPERFAAVADSLAAAGLAVVLTGTAHEAGITRAVAAAMHAPAIDLAGLTTLWTLGVLVQRADLVICNDTGISHVAAALGTPSVVVSSGADVRRWAPADAQRHHVLWHDVPCRPCAQVRCPIGHPCALGVDTELVRQYALQALQAPALNREPAHA